MSDKTRSGTVTRTEEQEQRRQERLAQEKREAEQVDTRVNENIGPYPEELADLISKLEYRPNWKFSLSHINRGQGSQGLTFIVTTVGYDTYNPQKGETYRVNHFFPVPPAAYDRRAWQRWILDQLLLIESHECCEFFQIDGERPFAPNHGPGRDPYTILELGTELDAKTKFTGEVDE